MHTWFEELEARLPEEVERRLEQAETGAAGRGRRGAVWTYMTTDQPFGSWTERVLRGLVSKLR